MKLSIIIPVYNQEELITVALDSIPRRDDIECIIVNDGSTDNTAKVVKNYIRDQKIFKFIDCKVNGGVATALNYGLDNSVGEYVCALGSDDYYYTDNLNKLIDEYLTGEYDMVYYCLKRKDGVLIKPDLSSVSLWVGSTKAYKRAIIGDTRYKSGLRVAEDLVFDNEIRNKSPKMKFTDLIVKFYNFPREGSLTSIASSLPDEVVGKVHETKDRS